MSKFRHFLRSLKPGEIGFCIAGVGTCSAALLARSNWASQKQRLEEQRVAEWRKVGEHVDNLVSLGTPLEGLSTIKFYQARLREDAKKAGVEDPTTDEICDEWLRRRNKGDTEALKIEHVRLRLKRFWHSIEAAASHRLGMLRSSNGGNIGPGEVLQDLLAGGMGSAQANDRLVHKTLVFLERLDLACCRHHPKCRWARDAPSFYAFLRAQCDIPAEWPAPDQCIDDFSPDAPKTNSKEHLEKYQRIPPSRVAQAMNAREQRYGEGPHLPT